MTDRRLLYYIFLLTIMGTIAVFYFISYPMISHVSETKEELKSKESQLEALEDKEIHLKKLDKEYEEYRDTINTLTSLFPDEKKVEEYLTQIETVSEKTGATITSLKVGGESKKTKDTEKKDYTKTQLIAEGDMFKLPVEIKFLPITYSNIVSFTQYLENLSRFTAIEKVTAKNDSTGKLEAIINLYAYVL